MKNILKTKKGNHSIKKYALNNQKESKGITLIALVITIIVLLILAGVAIASLTGENGLLEKAKHTNSSTVCSEADEKVKLAFMNVKTQIITDTASDSNYDARKTTPVNNLEKLKELVKNDLNASETETGVTTGFIVTTDTTNEENPKIKIMYKDSRIDENSIGAENPNQSGQIKYKITLSAQNAELDFDNIEQTVTYTVTFDSKGGTPVPSQTIEEGGLVTIPEEPYKGNEYLFYKWFHMKNGQGEPYDFNEPVVSDLYLYAIYYEFAF